MRVFVRAIITGIGLSVGKAIYDRVTERFFSDDDEKSKHDEPLDAVVIDDIEPISDPTS